VNLTLAHVNVNGLTTKHLAELVIHLGLLNLPIFVALTETKLDKTTKSIIIPGYSLVSRRDRSHNGDSRGGGGIALFARTDFVMCVATLQHSDFNECTWHVVHTSQGPLLLSVWYRPPNADAEHIQSLENEWLVHSQDVMGTVIIGDLNVHHQYWLKHSFINDKPRTLAAGRKLYAFCGAYNFEERVKKPTRFGNLLDLVLTDIPQHVTADVHPNYPITPL